MDALVEYVRVEFEVKRSRFIAELFPVSSQAAARETLKAQKTRYADASHVVHAFIAGSAGEIRGMSDDGEPAGTAARPIMDVLAGKKCTNALLTVTRYFGGTLLGTGGLVKAYGDTAKAVIAAAVFAPLVEKCRFSVDIPYPLYAKAERFLSSLGVEDVDAVFEIDVRLAATIATENKTALRDFITELTCGQAKVEFTPQA